MSFCAKCGGQLEDGIMFCAGCGTPRETAAPASPFAAGAPSAAIPPPSPRGPGPGRVENTGTISFWLNFIDNSVLFKKPISCLMAIVSLLIPILAIVDIAQRENFFYEMRAPLVIAIILAVIVLIIAGIFGVLVWWDRRIKLDVGPRMYDNLRRFIQTLGEFLATFVAIAVFGLGLVFLIPRAYEGWAFFFVPYVNYIWGYGPAAIFIGPALGVVIIVATKIALFLLDPVIWLLRQIWRYIKWFFRNVINIGIAVERFTPVWAGITWLFSMLVVFSGLSVAVVASGVVGGIISAFGFIFMGFLVFMRYKAGKTESREDIE